MSEDSREFRPLNQMERNTIFALAAVKEGTNPKTGLPYQPRIPTDDLRHLHHNHLRVSYERMQGGFNVCVLVLTLVTGPADDPIEWKAQTTVWRGASRRSYKDARKPVKGEMLAFSRAVLYSRPVTI